MIRINALIIELLLLIFIFCEISAKDNPDGGMSFKAPKLDDEESYSNFLPRNSVMRCDACNIIMFKVNEEFVKTHKKFRKSNVKLPESDLIEVFERVCHPNLYNEYGVKPVDEVNRLSGPGTGLEEYPALTQSGGKWPTRIADMCGQFVEELGEDEIYAEWLNSDREIERFKTAMCSGAGIRDQCKAIKKREEL